jgi:hypothetical protein
MQTDPLISFQNAAFVSAFHTHEIPALLEPLRFMDGTPTTNLKLEFVT